MILYQMSLHSHAGIVHCHRRDILVANSRGEMSELVEGARLEIV